MIILDIDAEIAARLFILDQHCLQTFKTAYRPNTKRNYKSVTGIFERYCEFHGQIPYPVSEWQLIRFARYLGNGVTSFNTIKNYLTIIKRVHEICGYPFPKDIEMLRLQLKALKFELAGPVKKAVPVTPQLLLDLYQYVDVNDDVEIVAYVGLLIGFCLFLRKSNLVPDTKNGFILNEQLAWQDLWYFGNILMVSVKWSKTLQYKQKELDLPLIKATHLVLDPTYWIEYLRQKFQPKAKDPLLSYPQQGELVPITYSKLAGLYKKWVEKSGRNSENYTLHGLRRGGANHALTVGLCGEDIQLMGDWASTAYLQYLDLTLDRRITNAVVFMDQVDKMALEWLEEQEASDFDI